MSRPEDWRVTLDKITNDLQNRYELNNNFSNIIFLYARVQTIQEGASLELIKLVCN